MRKFALAVSVGIMAVSILEGCSATQTEPKTTPATPSTPTSHSQFIEVHDKTSEVVKYININHIITVSTSNGTTSILMDTSNGALFYATESYKQIVKEITNANQ